MTNEVQYVLRAGPSFKVIAERMKELGYAPANPIASIGWTAEHKDDVAGLIVVQSIPVIYPLVIQDEWQGVGIGSELIQRAAEYIIHRTQTPRVLAHTNHPGIQRLIEAPEIGMVKFNEQLYEWVRRD